MNRKLVIVVLLAVFIVGVVSLGGFYFWKSNFDRNLDLGLKAYNDLRRYSEAEKFFRRSVSLMPFSGEANFWLGRSLHAQGRNDESVEAFNRALSFGYDSLKLRHDLGENFYMQKDYVAAEKEFRQALKFNPNDADINRHISQAILGRRGDFSEALSFAIKATKLEPNTAVHWVTLSTLYFIYGKHEEALAAVEEGILLTPSSCLLHDTKARILIPLKKYDEALASVSQAFQFAYENSCKVITYITRAQILGAKGEFSSALANYKEATAISIPSGDLTTKSYQEEARKIIQSLETK